MPHSYPIREERRSVLSWSGSFLATAASYLNPFAYIPKTNAPAMDPNFVPTIYPITVEIKIKKDESCFIATLFTPTLPETFGNHLKFDKREEFYPLLRKKVSDSYNRKSILITVIDEENDTKQYAYAASSTDLAENPDNLKLFSDKQSAFAYLRQDQIRLQAESDETKFQIHSTIDPNFVATVHTITVNITVHTIEEQLNPSSILKTYVATLPRKFGHHFEFNTEKELLAYLRQQISEKTDSHQNLLITFTNEVTSTTQYGFVASYTDPEETPEALILFPDIESAYAHIRRDLSEERTEKETISLILSNTIDDVADLKKWIEDSLNHFSDYEIRTEFLIALYQKLEKSVLPSLRVQVETFEEGKAVEKLIESFQNQITDLLFQTFLSQLKSKFLIGDTKELSTKFDEAMAFLGNKIKSLPTEITQKMCANTDYASRYGLTAHLLTKILVKQFDDSPNTDSLSDTSTKILRADEIDSSVLNKTLNTVSDRITHKLKRAIEGTRKGVTHFFEQRNHKPTVRGWQLQDWEEPRNSEKSTWNVIFEGDDFKHIRVRRKHYLDFAREAESRELAAHQSKMQIAEYVATSVMYGIAGFVTYNQILLPLSQAVYISNTAVVLASMGPTATESVGNALVAIYNSGIETVTTVATSYGPGLASLATTTTGLATVASFTGAGRGSLTRYGCTPALPVAYHFLNTLTAVEAAPPVLAVPEESLDFQINVGDNFIPRSYQSGALFKPGSGDPNDELSPLLLLEQPGNMNNTLDKYLRYPPPERVEYKSTENTAGTAYSSISTDDGRITIVADGSRVISLDTSNINDPVLKHTETNLHGGTALDIIWFNDLQNSFCVSAGIGGAIKFRIFPFPNATFVEIDRYDTTGTVYQTAVYYTPQNWIFLLLADNAQGFSVLNATSSFALIKKYPGTGTMRGATTFKRNGDTFYALGALSTGLRIFNATNVTDIHEVGSNDPPIGGMSDLELNGDNSVVYCSDGNRIIAMGLSDVTQPQILYIFPTSAVTGRMTWSGDLLFYTDGSAGWGVLSTDNPNELRSLVEFPTPDDALGVYFNPHSLMVSVAVKNAGIQFYLFDPIYTLDAFPTVSDAGVKTLRLTAFNIDGEKTTADFTVTIVPVQPPTLGADTIPNQLVNILQTVYTLATSSNVFNSINGYPMLLSARLANNSALPPNYLVFTPTGPGTGVFSKPSTALTAATLNVSLTAISRSGAVTTYIVFEFNHPPELKKALPAMYAGVDQFFNQSLPTDFVIDQDGDPLIITIISGPSWPALVGNRVEGTPTTGDIVTAQVLQFKISDGKMDVTASTVITVKHFPTAPAPQTIIPMLPKDTPSQLVIPQCSSLLTETMIYNAQGQPPGTDIFPPQIIGTPLVLGDFSIIVTCAYVDGTAPVDYVYQVIITPQTAFPTLLGGVPFKFSLPNGFIPSGVTGITFTNLPTWVTATFNGTNIEFTGTPPLMIPAFTQPTVNIIGGGNTYQANLPFTTKNNLPPKQEKTIVTSSCDATDTCEVPLDGIFASQDGEATTTSVTEAGKDTLPHYATYNELKKILTLTPGRGDIPWFSRGTLRYVLRACDPVGQCRETESTISLGGVSWIEGVLTVGSIILGTYAIPQAYYRYKYLVLNLIKSRYLQEDVEALVGQPFVYIFDKNIADEIAHVYARVQASPNYDAKHCRFFTCATVKKLKRKVHPWVSADAGLRLLPGEAGTNGPFPHWLTWNPQHATASSDKGPKPRDVGADKAIVLSARNSNKEILRRVRIIVRHPTAAEKERYELKQAELEQAAKSTATTSFAGSLAASNPVFGGASGGVEMHQLNGKFPAPNTIQRDYDPEAAAPPHQMT